MERARRTGTKSGKPIGRPTTGNRKLAEIHAELAKGTGILKTARMIGVGVPVASRGVSLR